MSFYEEESTIGRVYDRRVATRLWRYLRPHYAQLSVAVALMFAIVVLEAAGPLILRRAIDNQISLGQDDQLAALTLLFLATVIGVFVTRYAQAMLTIWVGQRVVMQLRLDVFTHLQRMAVPFYDRNPVGRIVTRVTNDVQVLEQVVSQGVIQIVTNLVMVTGFLVVLLVLDWRLALLMYVFLPFLTYAVWWFAKVQRQVFSEQRVWLARLNAYLNEIITGVAVIQLFNRQRHSRERFDERNQGFFRANMRFLFWYAVFEPTVVIFGAVTTGAILWYGGLRSVDDTLTLGTLVAFISYMQRFYWPIRMLSEQYTTVQSAAAAAERIFDLLDEPEEIRDVDEPRHLEHVEGKIDFRNVWFAYNPGQWVLRDVSFTIAPGEKVAIVGATGAGKSTTIGLLSRFYDVQQGAILVDDVPITELPQRELRRHVGLMLQDPFIYTDTILENIRLRDQTISREQVERAAAAVGASWFIERTPNGYDTVLAERGANLSTGQKQLIALARVAAFDPEIVLVMDEATASIDPETEAIIQRGIDEVTSGRTSIIIAHRLNTIRAVDRILVLQRGELLEQGTHEELLAARGIYYRLYELQYRGQELDATAGAGGRAGDAAEAPD